MLQYPFNFAKTNMKSNKQRREEIKARRLERAARLAGQLAKQDVSHTLQASQPVPGMALADQELLARHNNTYGPLPVYYLDRVFTCRDCGAEEIWTAKQQKWWYEVIHASINSQAVRCLACRRARRAQNAAAMAHEGAGLLREQAARLRALGASGPTAQALAEVEAALQSKWWSLRKVAIETLGRWGGPRQIAQLEAFVAARAGHQNKPHVLADGAVFVAAPAAYKNRNWECAAADAAAKALRLRQQTP